MEPKKLPDFVCSSHGIKWFLRQGTAVTIRYGPQMWQRLSDLPEKIPPHFALIRCLCADPCPKGVGRLDWTGPEPPLTPEEHAQWHRGRILDLNPALMQATPRAEHQEVLGAPSVHLDQQLPDNADCPQPVGNTSYLQAHPSARLVLKSESAPTSSESVRRQPDPQVRPSKLKQTTLSHFNLAKPLPLSAGTSVEVVPEAPTASPIQVFALEQDAESSTSVQAAAVETLKPDARPLQTTVLNISSDQEKSPASLNSDSAPTLSGA